MGCQGGSCGGGRREPTAGWGRACIPGGGGRGGPLSPSSSLEEGSQLSLALVCPRGPAW